MNIFRAKRIELNLSIEDVVKETKYSISTIVSIENGDYNFLPKTYVYYSVKAYGSYLRIANLEDILKKI